MLHTTSGARVNVPGGDKNLSLGSRDNAIAVGRKRPTALFCPKRDDSVVGGACREWQGCRSRTDHGVLLNAAY
ncbi:MAG: hypothetical protein J6X55_09445 [Victivallales bacterium]|nr:hypothetical protein [Victivallales bacterium]